MKMCSRNVTCALNLIITILTLSVPDGDLLQKRVMALNLITTILTLSVPDEDFFKKRVMRTKFDNYDFNFECT